MSDNSWPDNPDRYFELWRYHDSIGGKDKNWMIQIATWLIGISIALLAFVVSANSCQFALRDYLPLLGAAVSALGFLVVLVYGGYARRHWAIADWIAEKKLFGNQVYVVDPNNARPVRRRSLSAAANRLATCDNHSLAPVFKFFLFFCFASAIAHLVLLCYMPECADPACANSPSL